MVKNWLIGIGVVFFSGIAIAQPPHPPSMLRELKEDKQEEAVEFLKKYTEPERLEKLEAKYPRLYKRALLEALEQKHRLERLKEADPERYELNEKIFGMEIQSRSLGFDYRETASKDEKREIEKNLKGTLEQLFDLKEKDKEFELKRLEKEIEKLRDIMANRKKHKAEIIERHSNELLEEKEYMGW